MHASVINEQMKIAAARALADLAKEPVPQEVVDLYGGAPLSFGIDYVIPKPIDPRIIEWECPAVAQAAMISGVASPPSGTWRLTRLNCASALPLPGSAFPA